MDVFHYISKFQKSNREQKGTTAPLIQHPKHVTPMGDELVACALHFYFFFAMGTPPHIRPRPYLLNNYAFILLENSGYKRAPNGIRYPKNGNGPTSSRQICHWQL